MVESCSCVEQHRWWSSSFPGNYNPVGAAKRPSQYSTSKDLFSWYTELAISMITSRTQQRPVLFRSLRRGGRQRRQL
ncbi:hypothetical protein MUK42_25148 [Musa troglodytarum]|uniref:Uncharacterized protein n=1 Tax=Musa troglodytarum TaxID=320322 RepID=A0A9E7LFA7_9LILI|nr:hypothetical protein MUK42_25148 [Musa troglodytarum]